MKHPELEAFEDQVRAYVGATGATPRVARMPMSAYATLRRQGDERGPVPTEYPGECRIIVDHRLPPGTIVLGGDELAEEDALDPQR